MVNSQTVHPDSLKQHSNTATVSHLRQSATY